MPLGAQHHKLPPAEGAESHGTKGVTVLGRRLSPTNLQGAGWRTNLQGAIANQPPTASNTLFWLNQV